ncbi:ROK family glucokinase [Aneurinibacillus sp. BA2021]|nr:ROK family glucokinase [Aneurinibacillus sp. BA2021]
MYICFDVGGTNIKAGLVDGSGMVVAKRSVATQKEPEQAFQQFCELREMLCTESGVAPAAIRAAGIGVPGLVEMETGWVIRAVNLGWHHAPIAERASAVLNMPVFVSNDAKAAALGEMWQGAGKGVENLLCLTIGTGVGGGVITHGKILNGIHGLAGEIGHFRVKIEGGRPCNCGRSGCLETEASASAIAHYGTQAAAQHPDSLLAQRLNEAGRISSRDVAEAAHRGDAAARAVLEQAAFYLGYALASAYTVTAPARIVIGGGAAAAGHALFEPTTRYFYEFILPDLKEEQIIVPAALGNDAGIVGLAKLADMSLSPSSV